MLKIAVKKVDEKNVKNGVFLQKEHKNEAYTPIDPQSKEEEENRSSSPYQPGIVVTSRNGDEENSIIPSNHSAGVEEKQLPPPPPPPNTANDADWVQIPCPDGKDGCEVLHLSKRSPPPLPLNPPPATANEPIPPKDQSIHLHNNLILVRGHAAAHHCYWSLVMDTLIIAMVQYCDEMCKGCKNNSLQKHDLCKDPVKTIWTHHRKAILPRVDYAALTAKWNTIVYTNCGIRPHELETLFSLWNPQTMLTRWQEDLQNPNANTKVNYDAMDLERGVWRKQVNLRMTKITHPVSVCYFDRALAPILQKTFC